MKILMLNYEFPPIGGGAGQANKWLLKQFADDSRLEIDMLTSGIEPGIIYERFASNIVIYRVGLHKKNLHLWRKTEVIEWLFKAGLQYRRLLRQNSYDLAHAFFGFPTGWLCYRNVGKLPYIISLRGSDVPGLHARLKLDYKILAPIFKAIWKNASALISCSEGLKNRALRFLSEAEIDVITNGVDTERFYPSQADKNDDILKLITVGRLSVTKRIEILIDSVGIMYQHGLKVNLSIVGGGAMKNTLWEMVTRKKLQQIIKFTDRVEPEEMPELYRRHDLFISASQQEGMSNAMLEAMASGLPIITTRCEGVDELIADNGIVVEEATAEAIAEVIRTLTLDVELRKKMSVAAIKQSEKFSWKSVAEQYFDIYKKVIDRS